MLKHVRVPSKWIVPAVGTLIFLGIPGWPSPPGRPEGPLSLPLPLIPTGSGEAKLIFSLEKEQDWREDGVSVKMWKPRGQEFEI